MINKNKLIFRLALYLSLSFFTSSCFCEQESKNNSQKMINDKNMPVESYTLLYNKSWTLQTLKQKAINNKMFIVFQKEGKVSGFSGCNRFFGGFTSSAKKLTMGALAGTRKMCSETMSFETKVLSNLSKVNNYNIMIKSEVIVLYLYQDKTEVFSFTEKK